MRYLFEEEEIAADRRNLISAAENEANHNLPWYDNQPSDLEVEEFDAAPSNEYYRLEDEEIDEEENWDNDVHEVYFDFRLGWFTNDYDSGYDEPYKIGTLYPSQDRDEVSEEEGNEGYF